MQGEQANVASFLRMGAFKPWAIGQKKFPIVRKTCKVECNFLVFLHVNIHVLTVDLSGSELLFLSGI